MMDDLRVKITEFRYSLLKYMKDHNIETVAELARLIGHKDSTVRDWCCFDKDVPRAIPSPRTQEEINLKLQHRPEELRGAIGVPRINEITVDTPSTNNSLSVAEAVLVEIAGLKIEEANVVFRRLVAASSRVRAALRRQWVGDLEDLMNLVRALSSETARDTVLRENPDMLGK